MTPNLMNKRKTQLLALLSVIILIGMGMTVLMSPSEGEHSPYSLTLVDGEDRIKKVAVPPESPSCTVFEMELQSIFPGDTGVGEIQLEVINRTYFGGSMQDHWQFTFLGVTDGIYSIIGDQPVLVRLEVCFVEGIDCEKVTFTIGGHNLTSDEKNETHLSPREGSLSDVEYLTVYTGQDYDPFWEPSTYYDRQYHYLSYQNVYHITLWNLGTSTYDMWISDWEVWRDINENGVIDAGDQLNDYYASGDDNFDLEFETDLPSPYVVGEPISMPSLWSEELKVTVIATEGDDVPNGKYLIKITVDSEGEDCDFSDTLKLCVCDPTDNPDPCVIILHISQGWNLVSIGVELDDLGGDYTASAFASEINGQAGDDIIRYVVRWDGHGHESGEYEEYVVESGIGVDFPIDEGEGYYLYSTSPFEVEFFIVGDCPEDKTFDLLECWNLIGYRSMTPTDVGVWAQLIEDNYDGAPLISAIVKYDKDQDPAEYVAWYPGDPDDKFQVVPGEAYWIFSATQKEGAPYPA